jgi:heme-degrading monooxygenase HmoA
MIARIWSGRATPANAGHYQRHFTDDVAPQLKSIPGNLGAYLLRRETDGRVEFVAVTLWDSLDTVTQFTGPDPSIAIVEPAARAVLSDFDPDVRHYEVVARAL